MSTMSLLQMQQLFTVFPSKSPTPIATFPQRLLCAITTTSHQRLLCATTTTSLSPSFAISEYLMTTLQFSPDQAMKASKHLTHLDSPSQPDSVVFFLTNLGLTTSDIAVVTAYCPRLLCSNVDKTLTGKVTKLRDLGFSQSQIARLIILSPNCLRSRDLNRKLRFLLPFFGDSMDSLFKAVERNPFLLNSSFDKVFKPNIQLLQQECGLSVRQIAKLIRSSPRLLNMNPEFVKTAVKRAEEFGFPSGSKMFVDVLRIAVSLSRETVEAKMEFMKIELGWSDAEIHAAVGKLPWLLASSVKKLKRVWEFLINEVGLEAEYAAQNPVLFGYSIEQRMRPRLHVMKVLQAKGLPGGELKFTTVLVLTEKKFLDKFVHPFQHTVPGLADAYAAACAGEMTT